ncbi:hypothetical protein [Roseibium sp.]|uniref:hypothetical protein n=1 Tax=Roseibium sp. TaxID=1936156 RepID=UPI003A96B62F
MKNPSEMAKAESPSWMALPAERTFIHSFRGLVNGYEAEQIRDGADVAMCLSMQFAENSLRPVLAGLWRFASSYRYWALAPTGYHCSDCPCLARDEFLSVALLSSMQRRDSRCMTTCLDLMLQYGGRKAVCQDAMELALLFASAGLKFRPICERDVQNSAFPISEGVRAEGSRLH